MVTVHSHKRKEMLFSNQQQQSNQLDVHPSWPQTNLAAPPRPPTHISHPSSQNSLPSPQRSPLQPRTSLPVLPQPQVKCPPRQYLLLRTSLPVLPQPQVRCPPRQYLLPRTSRPPHQTNHLPPQAVHLLPLVILLVHTPSQISHLPPQVTFLLPQEKYDHGNYLVGEPNSNGSNWRTAL